MSETNIKLVEQQQQAVGAVPEKADRGWTRERVELVKRTICPKGISEDEFALFIEQCKRSGLDPLLKEAFCVARRANAGNRERPQWVTKYEFQPSEAGMLARAERFPDFKGIQASAVFAEDEILVDQGAGEVTHRFNPAKRKGSLAGAWARVVREGKLPVVVWLDFAGYVQQSPLWSKIPTTMIEKCARVAALRKAYPEAFGGLYVKEEMPAEEFADLTPERTDVRAHVPAHAPVQVEEAHAESYEVLGGGKGGATKASFAPAKPEAPLALEPVPAAVTGKKGKGKATAAAAPAPAAVEAGAGEEPAEVELPRATPGAAVTVAFGPHKGKQATALSDDELSETIELAQEKLLEQPQAKWARAMRENLAALEAETEMRFRGLSSKRN